MENIAAIIESNLQTIEGRIKLAQSRSPYSADSIRLLAVSKHQSLEKIQALQSVLRARNLPIYLGENYVQELREKRSIITGDCYFHFIGRLQKNKVRDALRYADLIESVDSEELAKLIDSEAAKQSRTANILVQVNISEDAKKGGFNLENARDFLLSSLPALRHTKVLGLMTMLMYYEEPELSRKDYRAMRLFRDSLIADQKLREILECKELELSMGLSNDFEIAVEEGATELRIGTAIFGSRLR